VRKLLALACAGAVVVGGGSVALAAGHGWNPYHHGQPTLAPAAAQPAPRLKPTAPAPTSAATSPRPAPAPTSAAPTLAPTSVRPASLAAASRVMPVSGIPAADLGALQVSLDGSQLLNDWDSSAGDLYPCPGGSSYSAPSLNSSGDLVLTTSGQTGSCAYVQSSTQYGYGTYEARVFVPAGPDGTIANWPAFYGSGDNWPSGGEIDAFEGLGGTDFAGYDPGLPAGHLSGPAITSSPGWHTVDAVWGPGTLAIYTDGQLSNQWSSPYLDITAGGTSTMWWTFDNFTGQSGYSTGQASTMQVQYFRYWAWQ
jgi:hypothetical protein